jgi:hypothetical protein
VIELLELVARDTHEMHGLCILRIQRKSLMAAGLSIEKPPGMYMCEGGRLEQCEILRSARWLGPDNIAGCAIVQRELASFGGLCGARDGSSARFNVDSTYKS